MAFTRVSPGHPHTVRAVTEGSQDKLGAHPARAGQTDNPEIGRVLKTAYPGQIRCTVAAPVAQKCRDFRFPVGHWFSSPG